VRQCSGAVGFAQKVAPAQKVGRLHKKSANLCLLISLKWKDNEYGRITAVYDSFEECFHALLSDPEIDNSRSGVITKDNDKYAYFLDEDAPDEATEFLGIYPSSTPDINKWTVIYHAGPEAEAEYHAFITNPENGDLIPSALRR